MGYPITEKVVVHEIFGDKDIDINFYSGLTVLVGPNGFSKTKVLKSLKHKSFGLVGFSEKIRYLSSNRIGDMEQYRSKTDQYNYEGRER